MISNTLVVATDAPARPLDPAAVPPALGLGFALPPASLDGGAIGLVWGPAAHIDPSDFDRFSEPGHVKVRWDVTAEAGFLKIVTRFIPTDDAARDRLLDARSLAGPLGELVARRGAGGRGALGGERTGGGRARTPRCPPPAGSANPRRRLKGSGTVYVNGA